MCSLFSFAINVDGIEYNVISEDSLTVEVTKKYGKYSGEIVIPESVAYNGNNYSVTSIGDNAFSNCYDLTSVTIPTSVTSIGRGAFHQCWSLISVTIPNSVTSIGNYAFDDCSGLTSVTIPNSVTSIGEQTFWCCSGLTSVTIPNSVTSIGREAFYACEGLTTVTISSSLTSIGYGAFHGCYGITLVKVPVTDYASFCENRAVGLISSFIGKPVELINNDGTEITEFVVPDGVTSVGSKAFINCTGLTSIAIPNSVTRIENNAFSGCTGLTSITIPNSVTSIGQNAFSDCSSLASVSIPKSMTIIDDFSFSGCSSLTSITIPNSVISIGQNAFYGCSSLASVSIPNSVTSIGNYAFQNCSGLTTVTIGSCVTSIGRNAFEGCSSITLVKVPVTDYSLFCNNKAVGLIYSSIGKPVQLINKEGSVIKDYIVPEGVTSISSSAFRNCTGLTSVTIPNGVRSIEDAAFSGCSGLSSFDVPNSVSTIGGSAFQSCTGLTTITIPGGVTSMGNNAFTGCYGINLVKVTVTDYASFCENKAVGLVYSNIGKPVQLINNEGSEITEYVVPEGVTSIGNSAFRNCTGLTSVSISNSVTSIGSYAFSQCSGLTSVTIGSGVTSIGGSTFSGCESLETVIAMPNIPPHIEDNTFPNAKDISLYVPMGRKGAYEAADVWRFFKEINEWEGTIFKAVTPQGIEMQFRVVDEGEKTVETYARGYEVGEDFVPCIDPETEGDLIIPAEIEGYRVVGIGSESFRECMGLSSASLPTGITYIGEGAFRLATSLKAVTIPEGVEEIRAHSFNGCPLTTIVLPSTLKRITGTYVFRNSNAKNETCSFIANMKRPSTLDENSIMGMEYYDLYVPKGRKEFYLSEPQWDKFRNIYEMGEVDDDVKDIVTAKNVTMKAGEKVTLTVSLNTIGNADYNGYQFNLYLPEGISVATDENGNYLVTEKTGRKKVALPLDDGSMLFYTTADKNHAALASGTLMEIELTADSALAAGKYTARIDRVVCATRDNESVSLPSSTATVTVEKAGTDTPGVITADDVEGEPASRITLPVFLNNAKDINAFYFDLTLPKGVAVAEDKNGQFVASFTGDYADTMLLSCLPWDVSMGTTNNVNTWRFIATPKGDDVFRANAGRVMNVTLEVDKDMAGGVYTARMNVVKLVEANDAAGSRAFGMMHAPTSSAAWTSYSTITIKTQKQGDVNGDNTIDVADIATVISVMAGSADVSSASADVNGDGTVDVADIAAIIDTMAANARRRNIEN